MIQSFPEEGGDYWAYDSNNNELDCGLKAAQRFAKETTPAKQSWADAECEEPIVIRNLLSDEEIDQILQEASADGVWPRGRVKYSNQEIDERRSAMAVVDASSSVPSAIPVVVVEAVPELRTAPHHFAWENGHVVLYMHNNGMESDKAKDNWFVETLPIPWSIIRGAMEYREGMLGIPIQDPAFVGSGESMQRVRTIELHHYSTGGGLLTPGHRDCGSDLTISILLSCPESTSGGDFVTYTDGVPKAHKMGRGDAILFKSEKLHNVSTVTKGIRQSLVVELWPDRNI